MIVKHTSLISICKSLSLLNKVLLFFILIVLGIFLSLFFRASEFETFTSHASQRVALVNEETFEYEKIGAGPFLLNPGIQSFPFPDLSNEVLFLGRNTRPDSTLYEVKLHMGLRGCDQTLRVSPGQKIYLSYVDEHLNFSEGVMPLWIKPYLTDKEEVWVEIGVYLASESGEVLLEKVCAFEMESRLNKDQVTTSKDLDLKEGLKILRQAKWWASDRLFETYGGETYAHFVGQERLEFEMSGDAQFLYVNPGDLLTWKESKWQKPSDQTKSEPLARLISVSPYKMEWELWDKSGFEYARVVHSREKAPGITLRIEEVFNRIRQRTTSRISCRIDNKAMILKQGDWLIHLSTGWHTLKTFKEVEAVLNFKVKGELFVFDGLQYTEGKPVFCGTLFDPMRTQIQNVRLPIAQARTTDYSPHTKKPISSKIRSMQSNTEPPKKTNIRRARKKSRMKMDSIDDDGVAREE